MDALKSQYASHVVFAWVDIEDHADVLDNVDVENFPTLLISDAKQVYFWGAVLPHTATASQLIDRVLSGKMPSIDAPDILALDQRLRVF